MAILRAIGVTAHSTRTGALKHLLGVLAVLTTACGPTSPPIAPSAGDATPVAGGRIVEASSLEIKTLQPVLVADAPSARVVAKLYETLARPDPNTGELRPHLGRWSVSPDGRTYSWEIARDATWSDGAPITADDYLVMVKAVARSKASIVTSRFQEIEGFAEYRSGAARFISGIRMDSADPKRFTVRFKSVYCPAPWNAFGSIALLPAQVFARYLLDTDHGANLDAAPENVAPRVVSGPFQFKEWRPGDQVVLTRNPRYWRGAPFLDEFVHRVVPSPQAVVAALKTGEASYAFVTATHADELRSVPALELFEVSELRYKYIGWNLRSPRAPALGDVRVRQALAYAFDMDGAIRAIESGHAVRALSHHPPTSWAFTAGLKTYRHDIGRAEALLREAGYSRAADGTQVKNNTPLSIRMLATPVDETLLQIAVEEYRKLGVAVRPEVISFEAFVPRLLERPDELDSWIGAWRLSAEPDPYAIWHSSQIPDSALKRSGFNVGGFASVALDRAIEAARSPADGDCSVAARKRHYDTFNRILNEEQPYNFAYVPAIFHVVPKTLRNFAPGPFAEVSHNIERWWLLR